MINTSNEIMKEQLEKMSIGEVPPGGY